MRKQMLKSALIALAGVGLMSGSAMATSYWKLVDTSFPDDTQNQLMIDRMGTNGSFGIFWDYNNDGLVQSNEMFEIFSGTDSKSDIAWLSFGASGTVQLTLYDNATDSSSVVSSGAFSSRTFGYYFEKDSTDKYIFSDDDKEIDPSLGVDLGDQWTITSELVNTSTLSSWFIMLNNSEASPALRMKVLVDDVTAVPEPTTMLLFGAGVLGIASISRRSQQK